MVVVLVEVVVLIVVLVVVEEEELVLVVVLVEVPVFDWINLTWPAPGPLTILMKYPWYALGAGIEGSVTVVDVALVTVPDTCFTPLDALNIVVPVSNPEVR